MNEDHKKKIGEANKIAVKRFYANGGKPWNVGIKIKKVCKYCQKSFEVNPSRRETAKYCSQSCVGYGRAKILGGKNHWNWQGGKHDRNERKEFMLRSPYKKWRKAVFERDNYSCQKCGARTRKGNYVYLIADHIKPYAIFPKLRLNVSNGRTLCRKCDKEYGAKVNQYTKKTYTVDAD